MSTFFVKSTLGPDEPVLMPRLLRAMAAIKKAHTAVQICVLTAFSLLPKKVLILRFCLIHLKKSSTCQRRRYSSVIVRAGKEKLFVKKTKALPVSGWLNLTRRSIVGYARTLFLPTSRICWSQIRPVCLSTGMEYTRENCRFDLALITKSWNCL